MNYMLERVECQGKSTIGIAVMRTKVAYPIAQKMLDRNGVARSSIVSARRVRVKPRRA